jgi:hypothetical protein
MLEETKDNCLSRMEVSELFSNSEEELQFFSQESLCSKLNN